MANTGATASLDSGADTAARLLLDAGAVLHAGFVGTTPPDWLRRRLAQGELGGVVLFRRNLSDRQATAALCRALRSEYPDLVVTIDEEGGDVTRLEIAEGSSYPGNLALGRADDTALTEAVGRGIGLDLAEVGVNLNYAPDADVNANPDNPVIGVRSFGDNAALVARHTAAYVRGLQSTGVAACAKHFPGHGDTGTDSHLGLPVIELDDAGIELHLEPFRAAVEAGVKAVMTAHILAPRYDRELPATMSPAVLTGLLRERLGFEGLIVTDGIDMGSISGRYGVAEGSVKAIAAGADAICWGGSPAGEEEFLYLRDAMLWAVREGRLPAQRLHEAAERNRALARWSTQASAASQGAGSGSAVSNSAASHGAASHGAASHGAASHGAASAVPEHRAAELGHRAAGLEAARRALTVHGELKPLTSAPHVVEFAPVLSFAIDPNTGWGVAAPLAALVPGTSSERIDAPLLSTELIGFMTNKVVDEDAVVDVSGPLARAAGRPLVLVVRDLHRNPWMDRAVRTLIAARPDAVVVETGLPYGRVEELAAAGTTVLATYGAARVCGLAAAEALAGRAGSGLDR